MFMVIFSFCAITVKILTAVSSPWSRDPSLNIPQEVLTQEFVENDCFPLEFTWHHCVWHSYTPCPEVLRATSSNVKHLLRVFLSFVWLMEDFCVGLLFIYLFWLSHLYCSCLCFVPVCLSPFRVRWCLALQRSDLGSHLLSSELLVLNTRRLLSLHDESISFHFKFKNTYSVLNFGNTKLDNTQSLFQGNLKSSRDQS